MEFHQRDGTAGIREIVPLTKIRPSKNKVIVVPMYDAPTVRGLLELPDSAQNPDAQQGIVVSDGSDRWAYPDHILFKTYLGHVNRPFRFEDSEYLSVPDHNIVAKVVDNCLVPRAGIVVVEPDWTEFDQPAYPGGIILLPPQTAREESFTPPHFGTVLSVGNGCRELVTGDRVILPRPDSERGQYEIGFIDRNLYLIPETEILALTE